jgi:hypothetical protein
MVKLPDDQGEGLVEWILIVILVLIVFATIIFLLWPALVNIVEEALQSIQ